MKTLAAVLMLASVVAYSAAQQPWTNVARDKPALQTGTRGRQFAGLAVDGNAVGNVQGDSCSRTVRRAENQSAWWGVDLIRLFEIRRVIITLPRDRDVLNGARVMVGRTVANMTACARIRGLTATSGETLRLDCAATNVRYVAIFRRGGVIALCDVVVSGRRMNNRTEAILLSLNRTTLMSTPSGAGFGGRRAVDGNINQDPDGGSCSRTRNAEGAFWGVDLGRRSVVDRVVVYAMRTPTLRLQPLRNYVIEVSLNGLNGWRECETHFGIANSGSITAMSCSDRQAARFVRLRVRSVGQLAFCEVNVYGWSSRRRPPPPA